MSVLVAGVALVVPRRALDLHWPGGTDAFLDVAGGSDGAVGACADGRLASVSYAEGRGLDAMSEALGGLGLVDLANERFTDFAVVADDTGPLVRCDWLEWRIDERGFTYVWETGTEPGDMAVPAGWRLPGGRREARREEVETAEGRLQLAVENGMETWLDLATGQLHQRAARREEEPVDSVDSHESDADDAPAPAELSPVEGDGPPAGPLRSAVEELIAEVGWNVRWVGPGAFVPRVQGKAALFDVMIGIDDELEVLTVRLVLPIRVPAERRVEMAVLLNRLNYERMLIGAFEQDVSDGEVRWRTGMDVEGAVTVGAILRNALSAAFTFVDQCFPAIVAVAFAGKSADEAMAGLAEE